MFIINCYFFGHSNVNAFDGVLSKTFLGEIHACSDASTLLYLESLLHVAFEIKLTSSRTEFPEILKSRKRNEELQRECVNSVRLEALCSGKFGQSNQT